MENSMTKTRAFLKGLGLPEGDLYSLPDSEKRFPDGAQYRGSRDQRRCGHFWKNWIKITFIYIV